MRATKRSILEAQLTAWGMQADRVAEGTTALVQFRAAHADSQPYDLAIPDCQMPEMNGFAATAALRQDEASTGQHVPIIAMTANAMQNDREDCLAAGMDDYVSKPVTFDALVAVLRKWAPSHGDRLVGGTSDDR